jgi:hypothetical protein
MLNLIKRLFPAEPLPAHLHFHIDDAGNRVICDESACRPTARLTYPLFVPRHY